MERCAKDGGVVIHKPALASLHDASKWVSTQPFLRPAIMLCETNCKHGQIGVMVDRLTHKAHILDLNGESYRLKETKQLLGK